MKQLNQVVNILDNEEYVLPENREVFGEFTEDIKLMQKFGYHPIYATWYYFERTYIFKTKKEALKAYNLFEKNQKNRKEKICAWWYGEKEWWKIIKDEFKDGKRLVIDITFINPYFTTNQFFKKNEKCYRKNSSN